MQIQILAVSLAAEQANLFDDKRCLRAGVMVEAIHILYKFSWPVANKAPVLRFYSLCLALCPDGGATTFCQQQMSPASNFYPYQSKSAPHLARAPRRVSFASSNMDTLKPKANCPL